jgi:hypothetical protein
MFRKAVFAVAMAVAALFAGVHADARGGGGATYVYIPIYIAPPQVPGADIGSYNRIHKVALLTAVGTGLTFENSHFLGSKSRIMDIAGWRLDEQVVDTMHKYLGGRFEFSDIAYDKAKLAALPRSWLRKGEVTGYLKTLKRDGLDALIVVRPSSGGYDTAMSLQNNAGGQTALWENYSIEFFDAKTLDVIAKTTSRIQTREGVLPDFPGRLLGSDFAFDDKLTLDDAKTEQVRKYTTGLLTITLVESLRSLQLGVALPPIGDHSLLPPPNPGLPVKNVAIISAIGDTLHFVNPGNLFASKTKAEIPVADWNVDADAEKIAADVLSKRFTVKPAPVDREVLKRFQLFRDGNGPEIPGLTKSDDIDLYLVVLKCGDKDSQNIGIGAWHWTPLFNEALEVYANYIVLAVDAHTLKPVSAHFGTMSAKNSRPFPARNIDTKLWPKTPQALTPAAADTMRAALHDLLADSIPETLYRMGFSTEAPPQEDAAPAITVQHPLPATPAAAPPAEK